MNNYVRVVFKEDLSPIEQSAESIRNRHELKSMIEKYFSEITSARIFHKGVIEHPTKRANGDHMLVTHVMQEDESSPVTEYTYPACGSLDMHAHSRNVSIGYVTYPNSDTVYICSDYMLKYSEMYAYLLCELYELLANGRSGQETLAVQVAITYENIFIIILN